MPVLEINNHDIEYGNELQIDLENGIVHNLSKNKTYTATKLPKVMLSIMNEGGLVNYLKNHGNYQTN